MDVGRLRCVQHLFPRSLGATISYIVINTVIKQHGVLWYDADCGTQTGLRNPADILIVY